MVYIGFLSGLGFGKPALGLTAWEARSNATGGTPSLGKSVPVTRASEELLAAAASWASQQLQNAGIECQSTRYALEFRMAHHDWRAVIQLWAELPADVDDSEVPEGYIRASYAPLGRRWLRLSPTLATLQARAMQAAQRYREAQHRTAEAARRLAAGGRGRRWAEATVRGQKAHDAAVKREHGAAKRACERTRLALHAFECGICGTTYALEEQRQAARLDAEQAARVSAAINYHQAEG